MDDDLFDAFERQSEDDSTESSENEEASEEGSASRPIVISPGLDTVA